MKVSFVSHYNFPPASFVCLSSKSIKFKLSLFVFEFESIKLNLSLKNDLVNLCLSILQQLLHL